MRYYNIHTHQASGEPGVVEVVNVIIKDQMEDTDAPYRSYGIHPWFISDAGKQMEKLNTFASLKETVAIGEAGLDKLTETHFDVQEKIFRAQALLAESVGKPLIIHCVKAWQELLAIKKEIKPSTPWIIHGYRGKPELAGQLVEQGFYLSFGIQFNPAALLKAWPDHVLTETDEAETDIRQVYQLIAGQLALPIDTVVSKLAENIIPIFCFLK